LTKEKFLETTNGTSVGAAMEDGNWLEQRHLFDVNMDGRAGRADALEGSDADENRLVTHTSGNSDIVHEVKEDASVSIERKIVLEITNHVSDYSQSEFLLSQMLGFDTTSLLHCTS